MDELARLQRRFYELVTCGRGDAAGLLASGELHVYAGGYAARLHDVLADDYPKLRAAVGDHRFGGLVARYLRAHPPRSFTLRDAGLALPGFLAADAAAPPWAADLARLERARVEVFDAADGSPLTRRAVTTGDPADLPARVLAWVPASAVVPLTWAVDELWSAIEDGAPPAAPAPAARVALVWRRSAVVYHRTLDGDEAVIAGRLARGLTFAEVCASLADTGLDDPAARAAELLLRWIDAEALRAPG